MELAQTKEICYQVNEVIKTIAKLLIFRRIPIIFRMLSESHTTVSEDFRKFPRKIRRCVDLISTNFGSFNKLVSNSSADVIDTFTCEIYRTFYSVKMRLFSMREIHVIHSSLYNNLRFYPSAA